jgi:hypothetical protein
MKIYTLPLALFVMFLSKNSFAEQSCYELNRLYGQCAQGIVTGSQCDFVMPERCRGGVESDRGLRDGVIGNEKDRK